MVLIPIERIESLCPTKLHFRVPLDGNSEDVLVSKKLQPLELAFQGRMEGGTATVELVRA